MSWDSENNSVIDSLNPSSMEEAIELCLNPLESNFTSYSNGTAYVVPFYCSSAAVNLSTCLPVQSSTDLDTIRTYCKSSDLTFHVGTWMFLVIGLVGNGLAMITICSLPTSTGTLYAGLLAASDFFAILLRGTVALLEENTEIFFERSYLWNLTNMMVAFSGSYSNWILVLICLERFLTVRFPFQKRYVFTIPVARILAAVVGLILFLVYAFSTWLISYENPAMIHVNSIFYSLLPLAFIIIFIILISIQLRIIHVKRKHLNAHTCSSRSSSNTCVDQSHLNHQSRLIKSPKRTSLDEIARIENSMTVMMMLAAIVFSVLTVPICTFTYLFHYFEGEWDTPVLQAQWRLMFVITQLLALLNLSINFFLYFLSTKKFRSQLYVVLTHRPACMKKKWVSGSPTVQHNNSTTESMMPLQNIRYSMTEPDLYQANGKNLSFHPSHQTSLTALQIREWSIGEKISA